MGPSRGASARLSLRLSGCLSVIVALVILGALIVWGVRGALEEANRASCQSNLAQIGKSMEIYASDHRQVWPDVFTEESTAWDDVGNTRTDEWDPVANQGEPPKAKPGDNGEPVQSNTANLWLLIAQMKLPPHCFVCPSSAHQVDEMAEGDWESVRDFRGETFVNFSFQNVLGEYRLTSTSVRASTVAVAADANPMRRDFRTSGMGEKKRVGVTDAYLADKPKFFGVGEEDQIAAWNQEAGSVAGAWELNSPNHGFKGQNVLYLDGHIEWKTHPYVGPNWDNIWLRRRTDVSVEIDPKNIETLRAYNDKTSYDGKSTLPADSAGDSFLVP